jgi:hypothetical protein
MSENIGNILADFVPEDEFAKANKIAPRTVRKYRSQPNGLPYAKFGGVVHIHVPKAREWLLASVKHPNRRRGGGLQAA